VYRDISPAPAVTIPAGPGTYLGNNRCLRVKAPGDSHSVMGLASWHMGSGFFGGGCGDFLSSHYC